MNTNNIFPRDSRLTHTHAHTDIHTDTHKTVFRKPEMRVVFFLSPSPHPQVGAAHMCSC